MLSKRYDSTEVNHRTWLHVPSGTHLSTSSDTRQVVEIQIETSTKMYTPFLIGNQSFFQSNNVCQQNTGYDSLVIHFTYAESFMFEFSLCH